MQIYVLQNMIVVSAGIFNPDKSDKNAFLQHHFQRFLLNFAHGFCLVLVSIAAGEEESTLQFTVSRSVLPFPFKI